MLSEYRLSLLPLTLETAQPAGKAALERALALTGFIPNMYARMANFPGLLDTYLSGQAAFRADPAFTPPEQEAILLTISRENGCEYCVSAHSFLADKKSGLAPAVTEAIRAGLPIPDAKLAALSAFTLDMVRSRGLPSCAGVEAFLAAGYSERHILGVVLAIAVKTLSNYVNHLFDTPLDAVFEGRRWSDAAK
jgi:AhpD family alkylhydroperoxidase